MNHSFSSQLLMTLCHTTPLWIGFTPVFKDLFIYVKSLHKDLTFGNIFSLQNFFDLDSVTIHFHQKY